MCVYVQKVPKWWERRWCSVRKECEDRMSVFSLYSLAGCSVDLLEALSARVDLALAVVAAHPSCTCDDGTVHTCTEGSAATARLQVLAGVETLVFVRRAAGDRARSETGGAELAVLVCGEAEDGLRGDVELDLGTDTACECSSAGGGGCARGSDAACYTPCVAGGTAMTGLADLGGTRGAADGGVS
jgi:hypothetical protein